MPRKIDSNQPEIVAGLREAGCVVTDTHAIGHGFPDIMVLTPDGRFLPMEIKAPGGRLNTCEARFHAAHRWLIPVVHSVDEALAVVFG